MKAQDILRQAARIIDERAALRDSPRGERTFERTARALSGLWGRPVSAQEVAVFNVAQKLSRAAEGRQHLDDFIDAAAYCALAAEHMTGEHGETEAAPTPGSHDDETNHAPPLVGAHTQSVSLDGHAATTVGTPWAPYPAPAQVSGRLHHAGDDEDDNGLWVF